MLAFNLISIVPNDGSLLVPNETLHTAPTQLTLRFSQGEQINAATLGGIQLVRSGGDGHFAGEGAANTIADVPIGPGYLAVDPNAGNVVIMRFSSTLPDDLYQLTILGSGSAALTDSLGNAFDNGQNYTQDFRLDLAPQVTAVVPQPVGGGGSGTLTAHTNEIDVYFSSQLDQTSATTASFYQLIATNNTATTADDAPPVTPQSVNYAYNVATGQSEAQLFFAQPLSAYEHTTLTSEAFRLRIGNDVRPLLVPTQNNLTGTGQAGDTFVTAFNAGILSGTHEQIYDNAIGATPLDPNQILKGSDNTPGTRNVPVEDHLGAGRGEAPGSVGVTYYNFADVYGLDPQTKLPLHNQITAQEEELVREIFQLFSYYTGATFIETPNQGIQIAVGDTRVLDATQVPGPLGIATTAPSGGPLAPGGPPVPGGAANSSQLAIVNGSQNWGNVQFGDGFFTIAMHEIERTLGLGQGSELP
ncbi:MAG TPA: hypothetical protein VGX76_15325, partial [Pirellulales bacterium]|nr:hypothetical protein [Pirellulales bacterium]